MFQTLQLKTVWFSVVAAFLAVFLIASTAIAAEDTTAAEGDQTYSSRTSLQLEGGYPETVVVGSSATAGTNDMLYAGLMAPNGLFWSDDFGENWNAMSGDSDVGNVIDVAVSDTPGTAFMIAGIALYRTQDNGATWTQLEDVPNVSQFFATGPDGLLAVPSRNGAVYVSNDDGDTFASQSINVAAVATTADGTVLALESSEGSEEVQLVSWESGDSNFNDTGNTGPWNILMTHPTDANTIVVAGNDSVEVSTGGFSGPFSEVTVPDGVSTGASVIRGNGDIYLGNEVSSDNGATWDEAGGWNWITFDDVNNYVYSASTRGVGRAATADGPFVDKVTGMTGVTISDIAQDTSKEVVWLAVQGGFAKTENFITATLAREDPTWEYPVTVGGADGSGIAVWVDADEPDNVIASTGGLFYSTDGGDSFTEAGTDVDGGATFGDIDATPEGVLYAAYTTDDSGGGVVKSTDNGVSWTDMAMPDAPALNVLATGDTVIVGVGSEQDSTGSKRGMYVYEADAWEHGTADESHVLAGAIVNDVVLVGTEGAVAATTSGAGDEGLVAYSEDGNSWSRLGGDTIPNDFWGQGLTMSGTDDDQLFASTARPAGTGQIYSCSISGNECEVYYTGLVDEAFNAMIFDGLLTGSNVGLFTYASKATIGVKKLKNKKKKQRIRVILKDKVTNKKLNKRTVKLYRKKPGKKKFKFFKKGKMKKGKVIFKFKKKVKGQFQARWLAGGNDKGLYETVRSKKIKFKKKK